LLFCSVFLNLHNPLSESHRTLLCTIADAHIQSAKIALLGLGIGIGFGFAIGHKAHLNPDPDTDSDPDSDSDSDFFGWGYLEYWELGRIFDTPLRNEGS
jgi:hypothetical protein